MTTITTLLLICTTLTCADAIGSPNVKTIAQMEYEARIAERKAKVQQQLTQKGQDRHNRVRRQQNSKFTYQYFYMYDRRRR